MARHGARVLAFAPGVVSRESTSSNGGNQLYLQSDDGMEVHRGGTPVNPCPSLERVCG